MAGLQRSAQTFRRSGSSGLVWDERFLTEGAEEKPANDGGAARQPELRHSRSVGSVAMLRRRGRDDAADVDDKKRKLFVKPKVQKDQHNQQEREAASGRNRMAFRTRDVAPAAEPPSPRVSGCVLCSMFRRTGGGLSARRARPTKR